MERRISSARRLQFCHWGRCGLDDGFEFFEHISRDHDALDLGSAFADFAELDVAVVAFGKTTDGKAIEGHEAELTAYALEKLPGVPGIHLYGDTDPERSACRLGVIPLRLEHVSHFVAAAVLGYEFGIGVRSGCFCAHPHLPRRISRPVYPGAGFRRIPSSRLESGF